MNEIDNGYYINSWQYQATIHADNTWDVCETLTVNFLEPRHGIYHYLNRYYTDHHPWQEEPSATYSYYINIDEVEVEEHAYQLLDEDDYYESLNIRIGDEDQTVTGLQTYVISYRMSYPDDRCEDYDQLFHSVMAGNVSTGIGHFEFNLKFDHVLPASLQEPGQLSVFSAPYGVEKNILDVHCQVTDYSISGQVDSVPAYHAVTLYSRLPEGFYDSPRSESSVWFHVSFAVTLALLLYLLFDLLFRRHRQKAVPVVSFYPPEGMTSAEVGTVIDDSPDTSDLLSLLPWLAQEGYIRITEIPDEKGRTGKHADLQLDLLRPLGSDKPKYMHLFMEALFGKKCKNKRVLSSKLDEHCAEKIEKSKESLAKVFKGERSLCRMSSRALLVLLAYAFGCLTIMLSSQVDTFRAKESVFGLIFFAFSGFMWGLISADETSRHLHSFMHNLIRNLIVLAVFAFVGLIGYVMWEGPDSFFDPNLMLILLGLTTLVTLCSGRYMVDTPYRLQAMGELLGLREFIRVAELPKLKMLVDEDPAYFYKVLPYAMVFGLTDKWVKQFENIDVKAPDWYQSNNMALWSAASLNQSLGHSLNSISSQISSQSLANASASSGSTAGFAGGGGGGGGTGSW